MENDQQILENRRRTLANDPQYFGGYLNMARLNIYNISNHLAASFEQKVLPEEGQIPASFLCNKSIKKINWNHVYSKARRFLPILKVFDADSLPKEERETSDKEGKDFTTMNETLKLVFDELQAFRNDYSHYYSTEKADNRKLTISVELADFLAVNFKRAIAYTKVRMKDVLADDDYAVVESKQIVTPDNLITTEGLVFLTCIFLEREQAFQFIGKVQGLKGTQFNSFIATREVLLAYCLKLPHDKFVSEDLGQALTLDIINELNRCPKTLYEVITEEEKQQFRPDLDAQGIDNLIANSTNEEEREKILDEIDYEDYIESLTRRVRHSNRFPYFAMRYIEEKNVFDKLRFHIDLGKYEVDKYNKQFDGEATERKVVENAKAFGKLSSFTNQETVELKIDSAQRTNGFEQFAPHYNADNNKIGLSNKESEARLLTKAKPESKVSYNLKQPLPQAFLSLHELPKIILLEYLQKGKAEEMINDFIKVNDSQLMSMQFIDEIKEQLPVDWNEFGKRSDSKKKKAYTNAALQYLLQRKATLNKVLANYQLNDKQVPTRILNYWLNIKEVDDSRSVSDRIKLMKRDCMSRLKVVEKHKLDKSARTPKVGEMATFLAKDIVDMIVSTDKKQKITSFYYDKMQECLALYADTEKKATFIHIVTNELKLLEKGGHPFLANINLRQIRKTSQLYELYLVEKANKQVKKMNPKTQRTSNVDESWMMKSFYAKEWNEEIGKQLTVVKLPVNKTNIPFTIRQWEEKEKHNLQAWLHNITKGKTSKDGKKAIDLPTNLFDDTLCELLREALINQGIDATPTTKYNELLKQWWTAREDSTQDFYLSERQYDIYDEKVCFTINSSAHFADYYAPALSKAYSRLRAERDVARRTDKRLPPVERKDVERVFKNTIAETEKEIRMLQEEDRMAVLMLEQLMDNQQQLKLGKIDSLLNETKRIEQTINTQLSFDHKGKEIKDKTNPEIVKTIVAERKQKNYTEMRKYVHDRRLPELFEYIDGNELPLDVLLNELRAYNTAKQVVFDTIFALEKKIIETDPEGLKQLNVGKDGQIQTGNIQHKPYVQWLENKGLITDHQKQFINMVRNSFSHNQFPQRSTVELLMPEWQNTNIALQIAGEYKQLIVDIIEKSLHPHKQHQMV